MTCFRQFAMSLGVVIGLGLAPVAASDLTNLTDAEREALRSEVRTYLVENPDVLLEAINALEAQQAEVQAAAEEQLLVAEMAELHDAGTDWVGGNPDGDVTLVEFLDYRCGFCRRAHPEVTRLLEEDGNIRLIIKEMPILGETSVFASQFAIAVLQLEGPEKYKVIHDALMEYRGALNDAGLRGLANDHGLDADAVLERAKGPEVAAVIQRNLALAQRLQINGTPTFILEDEMIRGYVPFDGMVERVAAVRGE